MGLLATVLGASGYAGGELLRYLSAHPAIEIGAVAAASRAGRDVAGVLPHLHRSELELLGTDEALTRPADVVLSCLPSHAPVNFGSFPAVIDLSDRHRGDPDWTYGLAEFNRGALASSTRIANPGCYPTAMLLALVPFVVRDLLDGPVVVDALSGTSGAGRKEQDHLLHASVNSSVSAYGSVEHRHVPEMERSLLQFGGEGLTVSFTPHLVPMSRGLLVTARARLRASLTDQDAGRILRDAYANESFVSVIDGWPATKPVSGTNRAVVAARVDRRAGMIVCSAAIDNLGKGAAGQAVQNANLLLGLAETTGLDPIAVWP